MIKRKSTSSCDKYFDDDNFYHREDGPALEYRDGEKHWFFHGVYHRVDGPALECCDGSFYYLMDKEYSYEDWLTIKDFPLLW